MNETSARSTSTCRVPSFRANERSKSSKDLQWNASTSPMTTMTHCPGLVAVPNGQLEFRLVVNNTLRN